LPRPAKFRAFASLRFDDVVPLEAEKLRVELEALGVSLTIVNMKGGEDIDAAVQHGIKSCDTFIIFGTAKYGENTGNMACTYYESKFAWDQKKRIILIRMIPFDQEFEFEQAQFLFGLNLLVLPWMLGTPMPSDLVDKLVDAMEIEPPASQPTPQPAPQPAPQHALLPIEKVAWPVELAELVSLPAISQCLAQLGVDSLDSFAETIDLEEGHDAMLQQTLAALPDKPKKERLRRNRCQKALGDLVLRLRLFEEFDEEQTGSLSRVDCMRIPLEKMHAKSGGPVGDIFDVMDTDRDGLVAFSDLFAHAVVSEGEAVPPQKSGPSLAELQLQAAQQSLETQRVQMEEQAAARQAQVEAQAAALRRERSALEKQAAIVEAERHGAAKAKQQYEEQAASLVASKRLAAREQTAGGSVGSIRATGAGRVVAAAAKKGSPSSATTTRSAGKKISGCANLLTPFDNGSKTWYCDNRQPSCDRQTNAKPDGTYLGTRWSDRSRGGTFDMCDGCVQRVLAREQAAGGSAGGSAGDRTMGKCPQGHELVSLGVSRNNGWACDARELPGGCKRGCTGFKQSDGWGRFRCDACDYDLCDMCV
jgi:hypothetical protein